jgi:ABC-type transport system involved in cytochrome c biogenesis permease subunit
MDPATYSAYTFVGVAMVGLLAVAGALLLASPYIAVWYGLRRLRAIEREIAAMRAWRDAPEPRRLYGPRGL